MDALVEESKLTEACGKSVVTIDGGLGEDLRIRVEGDDGSGIRGLSNYLHGAEGLTL